MPRTKGAPNKNKRGLKSELKKQYGSDFDVIMLMGKNCKLLQGIADEHADALEVPNSPSGRVYAINNARESAQIANDELSKLAKYIEPQLKAVEHSSKDGRFTLIVKDLKGANYTSGPRPPGADTQ